MSTNVIERPAQRDFRPEGKDAPTAPAFPIIDSGTLVMLMSRIHEQRSRGLITRDEWVEEQREAINRTVPGDTRDMYQRALDVVIDTAAEDRGLIEALALV